MATRRVPLGASVLVTVVLVLGTALLTANSRHYLGKTGGVYHIMSAQTYGMEDCGILETVPPDKSIGRVVRLFVKEPLDPNHIARDVTFDSPQNDRASGDLHHGGTQDIDTSGRPFHIDLSKVQLTSEQFAEVRIVLKPNSEFKFYADVKIKGVGYGESYNPLGFCGAHIEPMSSNSERKNWQTAVFYVPAGDTSSDSETFNFGLNSTTTNELTIFIDPKVQNKG